MMFGLAASAGAAPVEWKDVAQRPLSPGTVAALVEHSAEPEVQEHWRAALKHAGPEIRAAAARAIYAAGARELKPLVLEALAAESEDAIVVELMRTVIAVGTPEDDASVVAAAKRLPSRARVAAWILLGRSRGIAALAHLPAARENDGPEESRRSLVRAVIRGGRTGVNEAAAMALKQGDAAAWYVVWEGVRNGAELTGAHLAASLESNEPRIRAITCWNLAMIVYASGKVTPELEKRVDAMPEAWVDPASKPGSWAEHEARFAYELLNRARRRKPREDLAWAAAIPKGADPWPFPGLIRPVAGLLTKRERAALVEVDHLPRHIELTAPSHAWRGPRGFDATRDRTSVQTLGMDEFPKGYVSGLVALTGCRDTKIEAEVGYTLDGRPTSVALREPLSPECTTTGRILFASRPYSSFTHWTDASAATEPGTQSLAITFLDAKSLEWDQRRGTARLRAGAVGGVVGDDEPVPGRAVRVGENIKEPKKIKTADPVYPAGAKALRIQGIVILEAVIDVDGRVKELRVLRGVEGLDEAAMDAVRQWEYTPTLMNGVAVPVIMTITVNFKLQ